MKQIFLLTLRQTIFLTIAGGVLVFLSAFFSYSVYQNSSQQLEAHFNTVALDRFKAVEAEVERNFNAVVALQSHFLASEQVTRDEFKIFTQPFLETIPSIQALEWIPRVADSERSSYEAQEQVMGISTYSITERTKDGQLIPAQKREEYFPVQFVAPGNGNERAAGFDLASNPARKQALEAARRHEHMVVTDPISLVQETGQQKGFLVFAPVSSTSRRLLPDLQQGPTDIRGFALGVYRMGDLVTSALKRFQDPWVNISITMVGGQGAKPLYVDSHSFPRELPALPFQRDLTFGTKVWQFQLSPTHEFIHDHQTHQWKWVLASSGTVAALLLLLLGSGLVKRVKVQQEVDAKTEELANSHARLARNKEEVELLSRQYQENHERMYAIVETASDGIFTIDEHDVIESVNTAAEEIFGYQGKELKGRNVSMLFPSSYQENPERSFGANGHKESRISGRIHEMIGIRNNGEEFPMELAISEVQLEKQRLFTWFVRDISFRKKAEEERDILNKELIDTSRRVGMADVATGVLHNVGNVLTSVNVAAGVVVNTIRRSSLDKVTRTAELIQEHLHDVGNYLTQDPKGQQIPEYLNKLGHQLTQEQETILGELKLLVKNIEHIKEIISVQQTVAKSSSLEEPVVMEELMRQALIVNQASLDAYKIDVVKEYMEIPEIVVDKHQVLQVLVNLISNAKYAMKDLSDCPRKLTVRILQIEEEDAEWIKLEVSDTGVGIPPENMKRMFSQGFTTKTDGHGFGLHSGALSAKLMGGMLTVHSEGEDQGATFTLTLPAKRREVAVA